MTTDAFFTLHIDDSIAVSLLLDTEFVGSPDDGFTLKRAVLVEYAIWLDDGKAEAPAHLSVDRTKWLAEFLKNDANPLVSVPRHGKEPRTIKLQSLLQEQWQRDQELQEEMYRHPVWGLQHA